MVSGHQENLLRRRQFREPATDLPDLIFKADLYQVSGEDDLVRRLCAHSRDQLLQSVLLVDKVPSPGPGQVAGSSLDAQCTKGLSG
jgi:hypothetical protein